RNPRSVITGARPAAILSSRIGSSGEGWLVACISSAGDPTGVDDQFLARHKSRFVGRQIEVSVGDVHRIAGVRRKRREILDVIHHGLVGLESGIFHHAGVNSARMDGIDQDRKSTRLNSSHVKISYAVFSLKKETERERQGGRRSGMRRMLDPEVRGSTPANTARLEGRE